MGYNSCETSSRVDWGNPLLHWTFNLKSATLTGVWVRFPPAAPIFSPYIGPTAGRVGIFGGKHAM